MTHRTPTSDNSDQPTVELTRDHRIYEMVQTGLDRVHELGGDPEAALGEVVQQVGNLFDVNVVDVLSIVQRHSQQTQPFDPAAEAPNSAASEVDPIPATSGPSEAATPDNAMGTMASEPALTGGSGGTVGSGRPIAMVRDPRGRFTAKPKVPPMSAGLAQALLDADAETWRVDNAIRTARVLVYAIAFDDLVRHAGGDGAA